VPRPVDKLSLMVGSQTLGVAIHYPGDPGTFGTSPTLAQSAARLEGERAFHVDTRGWSDIAYSVAIDQAGRVFDCRGIGYRCAANGNQTVNSEYGACTWLVGQNEAPTPAMRNAFIRWRASYWLSAYPSATKIVGHRDLYQTDCPGNKTYALIQSGELKTTVEENVPLSGDDKNFIADAVWSATWKDEKGNDENAAARLLRASRTDAALKAIVDQVVAGVVAVLPSGSVSAEQVATLVIAKLAAKLA
jgi:hypothetical protein